MNNTIIHPLFHANPPAEKLSKFDENFDPLFYIGVLSAPGNAERRRIFRSEYI